MIAVRGLLMLARVLGIVALAVILYAWRYPARLSKWIGEHRIENHRPDTARPGTVPASPGMTVGAAPPGKKSALAPLRKVAMSPKASKSQAAVAKWAGTKFHVAPEAIEPLVVEADKLSKAYKLSPNLIIAVMAIESNFHPYIQSEAGAQGLMQVMPLIHAKRYEKFGGKSSFLDPMVSLRVGAEILRDCVRLRDGSETEGLRFYFGGGPASDAYIEKVRAEQHRLNLVAAGIEIPAA